MEPVICDNCFVPIETGKLCLACELADLKYVIESSKTKGVAVERGTVFTITCIWGDPHGASTKERMRSRCWGYYFEQADASAVIEGNQTDISELGYYKYAVLAEVGEGPLSWPNELQWYECLDHANGTLANRRTTSRNKLATLHGDNDHISALQRHHYYQLHQLCYLQSVHHQNEALMHQYARKDTKTVVVECRSCPEQFSIPLTVDQEVAWNQGQNIQRVIPHVSKDLRELLISGTCPACWAKLFKDA